MRTIYGKDVLDSLPELLEPSHVVLVVVGMSGKAHGDHPGGENGSSTPAIESMAARLSVLLERARQAGASVVWVEDGKAGVEFTDSGAWLYHKARRAAFVGAAKKSLSAGGLLTPRNDEPLIEKTRLNAFVGTTLDRVLRNLGAKTVVVVGVATEATVESTARSAIYQDYYSVIVADCAASWDDDLHEASLTAMSSQCDIATSQQVLAVWG